MTHRTEGGEPARPRPRLPALVRSAALLPYVAVGFVLALGWYGWFTTCHGRKLDSVYKALQLFGLNFDIESCGPITWPLHVARVLAVAVSFGFIAAAVSQRSFALLRAGLRRLGLGGEPVFVIGYGRVGQAIAAEYARQGRQVVAIDRTPTRADHQQAEMATVELHEADATEADVDGWPVRLKTARDVVVALAGDDEGLAVAAQLAQRHRAAGRPPPSGWVHLRSTALVHRLREGVDLLGGEAVETVASPRPFLLDEAVARDLFVRHPLALRAREAGHGQVHVALYGFTLDMAWVALEQVLLNGVMPAPSLRPPRVTIVSPDAAECAQRWAARHPGICTVAVDGRPLPEHGPAPGCHVAGHLHFITVALDALDWNTAPLARLGDAAAGAIPGIDDAPVNLHLFCLHDNRTSLAAALALRMAMVKGAAPAAAIAVHSNAGAVDLADADADPQRRFLLAGDEAQAVRYLRFLNPALDRLARAMHAQHDPTTSLDHLPETLRASNVRAAYHWAQKLQLLGWEGATPLVEGFGLDRQGLALLQGLDAPALVRLAMLEHARWRQDRLIDGWREGPRDEERRQRGQLAGPLSTWSERLSDADKAKDAVQVTAFASQRFPASGGLVRRTDTGWEGPPPEWRSEGEQLTLAFPDGAWSTAPPGASDAEKRLRVLIPPERVWTGRPEPNARRAARQAALAAFAATGPRPLSLERLSCDDWNWRAPELDARVRCVALPPLVVGFAGPRDLARLPDLSALARAIEDWAELVRPPDGAPMPLVTGAAPGADAIAIQLWRARRYGPVMVFLPFGDPDAPRHDMPADAACAVPPGPDLTLRSAAEDQPGWTGHPAVSRAILQRATVLLAVLEDERAATSADAPPDGGTAATLAEARLRGTPIRRIDPRRPSA